MTVDAPPGRLAGKVLLVAGAGAIGDECARRYAAEGASVVLGDIRTDVAEAAVRQISEAGGQAIACRLDGRDEATIRDAVALTLDNFGGLDGLHANFTSAAEGTSGTSVLDIDLATYDLIMDTNARGFMLCTRHALPHIVARGGGSVVYTSSGAGTSPVPSRFAYAMSKAAINSLARHVATRFGSDNVRANAIAPGVVGKPTTPPEVVEIAMKGNMIKRLGRPLDIASMAVLLMSDEGSYITGQTINVDGGVTMRP